VPRTHILPNYCKTHNGDDAHKKVGRKGESSSEDQFRSFGLVADVPSKRLSLTSDAGQYPTNPIVSVNKVALVKSEKDRTS